MFFSSHQRSAILGNKIANDFFQSVRMIFERAKCLKTASLQLGLEFVKNYSLLFFQDVVVYNVETWVDVNCRTSSIFVKQMLNKEIRKANERECKNNR